MRPGSLGGSAAGGRASDPKGPSLTSAVAPPTFLDLAQQLGVRLDASPAHRREPILRVHQQPRLAAPGGRAAAEGALPVGRFAHVDSLPEPVRIWSAVAVRAVPLIEHVCAPMRVPEQDRTGHALVLLGVGWPRNA